MCPFAEWLGFCPFAAPSRMGRPTETRWVP